MWKNPTPAPPLPNYTAFRGPLSVERFAPAAGCKQVAWTEKRDARKTVSARSAPLSALHPNTETALQETTNQEPFHSNKYDRNSAAHYLSFTTHSLSVSSNEQEQCRQCVRGAAEQETVPLNWGGKLQQKPVQIRRDGFVIRLKCQLLQKPIPGLRSRIGGLNLQLFPPNCRNCKTIIGTLCRARDQR